ncbi:type II toxin-antitoxin system HigB family toxin [Deinococcus sp. A31D244]|uniref:type II toxin-antitoxin system HigB family toxin n=1 Tax=Deinococcus sp. A31D244 TaxID=3397675 RepID=UPI0039E042CC
MNVTNKPVLQQYAAQHPQAQAVFGTFLTKLEHCTARDFQQLVETFPRCDRVPNRNGPAYYIFNVGGNNHRVVAHVQFGDQVIIIRHAFSHAQYDDWCANQR